MARAAKQAAGKRWYVVDIEDNTQDLEPFRVLIQPISGEDWETFSAKQMGGMTRKKANPLRAMLKANNSLVEQRVVRVENYSVSMMDQSTITPTNGQELVQALKFVSPSERDTIMNKIIEAIQDVSLLDDPLPEA